MSDRRGALALGLVLGTAACEPSTDEVCPTWTEAEDDRCVLRAWVLDAEPLGEPGASDVQVALGPDQGSLLAWSHAAGAESHVVLASSQGEAWSLTEVTAGSGAAVEPAIAVGPEGRALLAWKQQAEVGEVYLATRDGSGEWTWPDAKISWDDDAYEPRVELGDDGEALLVWNQWSEPSFGVAVARRAPEDPDGPFAVPRDPEQLLSPPQNFSNAPRLALGPSGEALVTWYQAPVDDLMVFVSERRRADGAFSHPSAEGFLSPRGGPVDSHPEANPQPALHASGAAAVVWTQQRSPGVLPVYLATRDPDGTWHAPTSLDEPLSDGTGFARCPLPAFAPDGTLVVTWYETIGPTTRVMVWRDADEGPSATAPLALSEPGVEAVHPAIAIAPDGGTVVAWAQREDEAWTVVARRHQPEHDRWLAAEALSQPAVGQAPTPRIAADGRVLVAWAEGNVVEGRVRTARLAAHR